MKRKVCRICWRPLDEVESKSSRIRKRTYCSRKCMGVGREGNGNPNYGNRWSDEQKTRLSKHRKGNPIYCGENHPNYGREWSITVRRNMSRGAVEGRGNRTYIPGKEQIDRNLLKHLKIVAVGCRCEECGGDGSGYYHGLAIHHIDEDPTNNVPTNWQVLCFRCHTLFHSEKWKGVDRKYSKSTRRYKQVQFN